MDSKKASVCPNCGYTCDDQAQTCPGCQFRLHATGEPFNSPETQAILQDREGIRGIDVILESFAFLVPLFERMVKGIQSFWGKFRKHQEAPGVPGQAPTSDGQNKTDTSNESKSKTETARQAIYVQDKVKPDPRSSGERLNGYLIQNVVPLKYSNYYEACSDRCPRGHLDQNGPGGKCSQCHVDLPRYLIHESLPAIWMRDERSRQMLRMLSQLDINGILPHVCLFNEASYQYVVAPYPQERWDSLAKAPSVDQDRTGEKVHELGRGLLWLANQGYGLGDPFHTKLLEGFVSLQQPGGSFNSAGNQPDQFSLAMADVTLLAPAVSSTAEYQRRAIFALGQILYTLASGKTDNLFGADSGFSDVLLIYRDLLIRVQKAEFDRLDKFLTALEEINPPNKSTWQSASPDHLPT